MDLSPWIYYHCGFITLDLAMIAFDKYHLGFIAYDLLPLPIGTLWIYHLGFITRGHTSWIYHLGFNTTFPIGTVWIYHLGFITRGHTSLDSSPWVYHHVS